MRSVCADDLPRCKKPTMKRGNPDWDHADLAAQSPCEWPLAHGGPCNADPWADLLATELAEGTD